MRARADDLAVLEHQDLVGLVETRWATMTTAASRVTGCNARRNLASVVRSRAEKESSNK